MPAACTVEISFMCFGRGMPESTARWGPVSTQVCKHKRCKPKHKLPIGRCGETILTLTVMDDAASSTGPIDTRPPYEPRKRTFTTERWNPWISHIIQVKFSYRKCVFCTRTESSGRTDKISIQHIYCSLQHRLHWHYIYFSTIKRH